MTLVLPGQPETDLCFDNIPENLTCCGAITIPFPSLHEQDPELEAWLQRGPTILVNLGSHVQMESDNATQLALGLSMALEHQPNTQVLWKLKASAIVMDKIRDVFEANSKPAHDRVVITPWLDADPAVILESGHICCVIHHGGANTFYEALGAGTPQIALPVWLDTYNIASQLEYIGAGIWANRGSAPGVDSQALGRAILDVLGNGEQSIAFRKRAHELGEVCRAGGGRNKASAKILEMLGVDEGAL